jgi:hypothetical protein
MTMFQTIIPLLNNQHKLAGFNIVPIGINKVQITKFTTLCYYQDNYIIPQSPTIRMANVDILVHTDGVVYQGVWILGAGKYQFYHFPGITEAISYAEMEEFITRLNGRSLSLSLIAQKSV